jgi:UDP-N-acetylglucosamine 2-epimerase
VVGNSSSGVIEAPSLGTPSVDVGQLQGGRDRAASVITVPAERGAIADALRYAISPAGQASADGVVNPYGDGHAAERIAAHVVRWLAGPRDNGKRFTDVAFDMPAAEPEA